MTIRLRSVAVKQLPEKLSVKQGRLLFQEIAKSMDADRPRLVLDCAKVAVMDWSVIHLLLCCLEEAMKRNGDVKLAAIPRGAEALLERTGVNRLFDIFDSSVEAVSSFHQLLPTETMAPAAVASTPMLREAESAA